jgi:hypothetical protein
VNNNLARGICVITGRLCAAIIGGGGFFRFLGILGHNYLRSGFAHIDQIYDQIARINLNAATSIDNRLKTTMSKERIKPDLAKSVQGYVI